MEKNFAIKNEMQTDRKRIGFVVWMLFVFVFASFRGRGLGKNVIRNVNNSFESATRAFKRFCNVYFGTFC